MPKKKADKRVLVLVGGGLDSAVAAYQAKAAGNEVWGLSVHYGQDALAALVAAKTLSDEYAVGFKGLGLRNLKEIWFPLFRDVDGSEKPCTVDVDKLSTTYIGPILEIIGGVYGISIGAEELIIGYTSEEHYEYRYDLKIDGAYELKTSTPFADKTKAQVVKLGVKLEVPFDLTWSCFRDSLQAIPCGECLGCVDRAKAFKAAKVEDPLLSEDSKLRWILKGGRRGEN